MITLLNFLLLLAYCHVVECLCSCIVGGDVVSWCVIETQDSDMSFGCCLPRKVSTSSELQAANLLQVAVGEAQDTLMNTSPTQSVINV